MNIDNFSIYLRFDPSEYLILDGETLIAKVWRSRNPASRAFEAFDAEDYVNPLFDTYTTLDGEERAMYLLEKVKTYYRDNPKKYGPSPKEQFLEQTIEDEYGNYGEGFMRDLRSGN